jgi:glyoxylase-like metal-dependent hydrolase (beta-lactamase superfamily II)
MTESIEFVAEKPLPGRLERLSALVSRFVAPNPGPFTFTGTCAYIVGEGKVVVIDPGPDDAAHADALLAALGGREVVAILVTHTHRDHSPGARLLQGLTGAPVIGCGPHVAARPLAEGESNRMEGSGDRQHRPDRVLADGERITLAGLGFAAIATPGHTMNHLCFSLEDGDTLFTGDHVMGWSTSIVAPPDGAMGPYMASLEKLRGRPESLWLPGHGGPVREPQRFLRGVIGHRKMREASILTALAGGPSTIGALTPRLYAGLAPVLLPAAGLSVLAHLEDLQERGFVSVEGPPAPEAVWRRT